MILDNDGLPLFYRKMQANAQDFKLQKNGRLSFWLDEPFNRFYEMDSTFSITREIQSGNGYTTDEHELQILQNGNALVIALDPRTIDMRKFVSTGDSNATVIGNIIQEISPSGQILFEWKSLDHISVGDANHVDLTAHTIDYIHINAIEIDHDNNILISSRHLSEITKIDRLTGNIIWRLGGKKNQFTFINDPDSGFSFQHDIRVLNNGTYTLFDNGNFHSPPYSRAVEYNIDTASHSAKLIWQYRHSPDRRTPWMGNVQRLPNNNTLINYSDSHLPKLTEVTPRGEKAMELNFFNNAVSYRVFRFPWLGKAKSPSLIMIPKNDTIVLLFNKFGDPDVRKYLVYADTVPNPQRLIDSISYTAINIFGFKNGKTYYFRVTAKNSTGCESNFSNEESWSTNIVSPGNNLIRNGDFSSETQYWNTAVSESAEVQISVSPGGVCRLHYSNSGKTSRSVQFSQANIYLENAKKYIFEFDAYATNNRFIEVQLDNQTTPHFNYSQTGAIALTTTKKHFSFPFTMQQISDPFARCLFKCGGSDIDIFLDNISVKEVLANSVSDNFLTLQDHFRLFPGYPNPFNPSTTIKYWLKTDSYATVKVYDLLGKEIAVLSDGFKRSGTYEATWNAKDYASGVYVVQFRTGMNVAYGKILLLK